jgi:hypothetical protein
LLNTFAPVSRGDEVKSGIKVIGVFCSEYDDKVLLPE